MTRQHYLEILELNKSKAAPNATVGCSIHTELIQSFVLPPFPGFQSGLSRLFGCRRFEGQHHTESNIRAPAFGRQLDGRALRFLLENGGS